MIRHNGGAEPGRDEPRAVRCLTRRVPGGSGGLPALWLDSGHGSLDGFPAIPGVLDEQHAAGNNAPTALGRARIQINREDHP